VRRGFLLCACVLFPACQLALTADAFAAPAGRADACARRALALGSLLCAVFVCVFAALAARMENSHMLLISALSSIVPAARSWREGTAYAASAAERALFGSAAALELSTLGLGFALWYGFGWQAYTTVGGDVALNKLYSTYQRCEASIGAAVEFGLLLVCAVAADGQLAPQAALGLGVLVLACAPVQLFAVRVERARPLAAAVGVQLAVGVAVAALGLRPSTDAIAPKWLCLCLETAAGVQDGGGVHTLTLGALALAALAELALLHTLAAAASNFGKGLRLRAFVPGASDEPRGSSSLSHAIIGGGAYGGVVDTVGSGGRARFAIATPSPHLLDFATDYGGGSDADLDDATPFDALVFDGSAPLLASAQPLARDQQEDHAPVADADVRADATETVADAAVVADAAETSPAIAAEPHEDEQAGHDSDASESSRDTERDE
jgi:hypothetical protein